MDQKTKKLLDLIREMNSGHSRRFDFSFRNDPNKASHCHITDTSRHTAACPRRVQVQLVAFHLCLNTFCLHTNHSFNSNCVCSLCRSRCFKQNLPMQSTELHTPRARAPPPPIRVLSGSFKSGANNQLLYDLPSPPPRSMTTPPPGNPISPISPPTSPTFRSRLHASRMKGTPPPSHVRSQSPKVHLQQQQEQFTAYCRAW